MPMGGKKKPKGVSNTGGNSKIEVKGKSSFPSRYSGGSVKDSQIIMKETSNFSSRYK